MARYSFGSIEQANNTGLSGTTTLATNANTVSGIQNNTAVTPFALAATLGPRTLRGVLVGQGSGVSQTATAAGTNGQVLIASTAGNPAFATLTSGDGSITFTPGANTLSLQSAGGMGLAWTVVTGATQALVKSNGYFSNRAGSAVAFTLPATSAVGDMISVANMGARADGFTIAQNAGQYIRYGNQVTTTGVGGSLAATATGDAVSLVCSVVNTEFVVVPGSQGNIVIV